MRSFRPDEHILEALPAGDAYVYRPMVPRWGSSNAGLMVGRGGTLLIDTQMDAPRTRAMLERMGSLIEESPIRMVAGTHTDLDHVGGVRLLTGGGGSRVRFAASGGAASTMRSARPASLWVLRAGGRVLSLAPASKAAKPRAVGDYLYSLFEGYELAGPAPPQPDFGIPDAGDNGEEITVGGRGYRLLPLGDAHTTGDMAVCSPADRLVFCGDVLFCGEMPVGWQTGLGGWIRTLDRLLALGADTYVPGHGPPVGPEGVLSMRQCLVFLKGELTDLLSTGESPRSATLRLLRSERFGCGPCRDLAAPERVAVLARGLALGARRGRQTAMHSLDCVRALADTGLVRDELVQDAARTVRDESVRP